MMTAAPLLLPPPSDPMAVARVFIEKRYMQQDTHTLRYWCGSWWEWHTTHWVEVEERTVRSLLYHFTDKALYRDPKNRPLLRGHRRGAASVISSKH